MTKSSDFSRIPASQAGSELLILSKNAQQDGREFSV